MHKDYSQFSDRMGRAEFVAKTFNGEILDAKSILDVGCGNNYLKKIVGPKVIGVDLYGNPDLRVDLENEKLSMFSNHQFDLIVCTEVLEHLENLHEMLDEFTRVSSRYLLVSLPNCMDLLSRLTILFQGSAGKFYGLPVSKPEDRHRWFFNHVDADNFFDSFSESRGYRIKKRFILCNYSNSWRGRLVRVFIKTLDIDCAGQSYWALLEKRNWCSLEK